MRPTWPGWVSEMAWISDGDESLASDLDGINVVLNRARLAEFLALFNQDKDVRDLLILDEIAHAAGLPLTSTGLADTAATLPLRPFRIWEYSWLYKTLGLSRGGVTLLDLGGPDTHLILLAALAGCSVTSLDINPEFVQAAQECAGALNLTNFASHVGDMRDLSEFEPESFDVIVSCSVLEHLTAHDQETAIREAARVLKPGGIIGLTFDYGPAAPGANIYLPPPHDPPASAAEVVSRYAREGLVVAGNPFCEDPSAGSLFRDEVVRYTVASLFLVKPPALEIRPPLPEAVGTALDDLTISALPSRIRTKTLETLARGLNLAPRLAESDAQLVEAKRVAEERRLALEAMDQHFSELRSEAEARERGLHELTTIIALRDARIAELERVAEERRVALEAMDSSYSELSREAESRERVVRDLTALIAEREVKIGDLEKTAEQRLLTVGALEKSLAECCVETDRLSRLSDERAHQIRSIEQELGRRASEQAAMAREIVALETETLLKYFTRRFRRLRSQ